MDTKWQQEHVVLSSDGINQIVIRTLAGFCYLCQQLAYLLVSRIFLVAGKIGESLRSYQEYPDKSVGKQGGEIPDYGASKKLAGLFIRNLVKLVNLATDISEMKISLANRKNTL
jgi:hypothetical protein